MTNYLARFRSRWRNTQDPARTSQEIGVSPYATVSLSENGAVFLHACSGIVFTSNRIGAQIWRGLVSGEGVEAIAGRISRENGVEYDPVRQDTTEFISELETQGFLVRGFGR